MRSVLGSDKTALDFLVNLSYHLSKLHYELVLVLAFITIAFSIIVDKLVFEEVVVALLAGPDVGFSVWEQVVRAEREQVEFTNLHDKVSHYNIDTYVLVVEMVSSGQANEQRFVTIFAHQLVQLLPDVVHPFILG